MTYATGNIVTAADMNSFIYSINTLLGPGMANIGLGQTNLTPNVNVGDVVKVSEFISLCTNITRLHYHQHDNLSDGPPPPSISNLFVSTVQNSTSVSTLQNTDALPLGSIIWSNSTAFGNLTTVINKRINGRYHIIDLSSNATITASNVDLSWSNRDTISVINRIPSLLTTVTSDYYMTSEYGTDVTAGLQDSTSWGTSATREFTVKFNSPDAARYFFNAGGSVIINFAGSNLAGNLKSEQWQNLLDNGIVDLSLRAGSFRRAGTDFNQTVLLGDFGYYSLTPMYTTVFTLYNNSAAYSMNYLKVELKSNGVNLGGLLDNGNIISFKVSLMDDATDQDVAQGLLNMNVIVRPAWNTYINNTWGTAIITTVTNSQS